MNRFLGHLIAGCFACAIALCAMRCSGPTTAGGGTDMPNGTVVAGRVLAPDSSAAGGVPVELREIVITGFGDSISGKWAAAAESDGRFAFENINAGRYIVYALDSAANLASLNQFIDVASDTGMNISAGDLLLSSRIDITGHVLLPEGVPYDSRMRVFVPGLAQSISPDSAGKFTIQSIPQGTYDIGFVFNDIINYSRISISAGPSSEVYLWDFEFAMLDTMANSRYSPHRNRMNDSYYISPKTYPESDLPAWLDNADTTDVKYYSGNKQNGEFEEWHHDTSQARKEYDRIVVGTLIEGPAGPALIAPWGDTLTLTGAILDTMPKHGEVVAAAVKEIWNSVSGEMEYEVIALDIIPEMYLRKNGFCDN